MPHILKMKTQKREFEAAEALSKALDAHDMTSAVDDDYPAVRHRYESALKGLIDAMIANGRFVPGNRFGLRQ